MTVITVFFAQRVFTDRKRKQELHILASVQTGYRMDLLFE